MNDLISRQAAIEAIEIIDWYHQNSNKDMVHGANSDEHQAWYKAQDIYEALEAVPSAEAVPQSEQYKKGFEDAKRAFLVEYARESENMRKRNAQLEVMLNAQKAISADRPRPIDPTYVFDPESGVVPLSACEPKGPKTIIYADRPIGEWTLLTEERPVDDYEIIATVYWPGYGDSAIAVGHIDRFDNWHLYSPTEGALIKGFEVIAWKTLPEPYCGADMRGEDE